MDLLAVTAIAAELRREIAGAILSRVVQTAPEALVLEWWAGGRGERRLVVAPEPWAPRLHLTALRASELRELPPPPGGPPRFAAYLRAHGKGARLVEVRQPAWDRVVTLRLERGGEAPVRLDVVVELLGSHAQVLVVGEDGRVREVLRRTGGGSARALAPGDPYVPPPLRGRPPGVDDRLERVAAGGAEPRIYRPTGGRPVLAMTRLPQLEPDPGVPAAGMAVLEFASASAAVEALHASPADRLARLAAPLRARIEKARARLRRRLAALEADLANLARGDELRRTADLLAAYRTQLRKGQREARLPDLFDPQAPLVTIPLDPALGPQENVDAYYARARKARRGLGAVAARRIETEAELADLDRALHALDAAREPADLAALEAELAAKGISAGPPRPAGRERSAGTGRDPAEPPLRRFRSSDGLEIVVGKSNAANDYLSTRLARPDDLWLHVDGYPGAHVLVRHEARHGEVPERTVVEAATLAALHSRARDAGKVGVRVASAGVVRKPRGARPGLVILTGPHRTVVVAPDPGLPDRLAAAEAARTPRTR